MNLKVIWRQLSMLGYAAELATDGAQALAMWRSGAYTPLLTDLHMPELDGYALAETIRREEAARGMSRGNASHCGADRQRAERRGAARTGGRHG